MGNMSYCTCNYYDKHDKLELNREEIIYLNNTEKVENVKGTKISNKAELNSNCVLNEECSKIDTSEFQKTIGSKTYKLSDFTADTPKNDNINILENMLTNNDNNYNNCENNNNINEMIKIDHSKKNSNIKEINDEKSFKQVISNITNYREFLVYSNSVYSNINEFIKIENLYSFKLHDIENEFLENSKIEKDNEIDNKLELKVIEISYNLTDVDKSFKNNYSNYLYYGYADSNLNLNKYGVLISTNEKYIGEFKNNLKSGKGRNINLNNNELYEGEYSKDLPNGEGKYFLGSFLYNGSFVNGLQEGYGEEINSNTIYKGYFSKDIKQGVGILNLNDITYIGEFKNNTLNGIAKIVYNDNRVYEGQVKNFTVYGLGSFTWPNNEKYIGQYKNNRRNGFGIMLIPSGIKYEGFWLDGSKHGYGIETHLEYSCLREYRYNIVLKDLCKFPSFIANEEYSTIVNKINKLAVMTFDKYQKIENEIKCIEDNIKKLTS